MGFAPFIVKKDCRNMRFLAGNINRILGAICVSGPQWRAINRNKGYTGPESQEVSPGWLVFAVIAGDIIWTWWWGSRINSEEFVRILRPLEILFRINRYQRSSIVYPPPQYFRDRTQSAFIHVHIRTAFPSSPGPTGESFPAFWK